MRFRQFVSTLTFLAACFAATASGTTLPPAASAGVSWLQSQIQTDGSLASENQSIATPLQVRSETIQAFSLAGAVPQSLTTAVTTDTDTLTQSLARHIQALVQASQDPTAQVQLLLANQNADGGFGSQPGDSSDALDTAYALLALRATNSTSATSLSNALQYLIGNVNPDGGYGLPFSGSGSQVYVTAYVLLAYQGYSQSYPLTPQVSGAQHWLVAQQAGGAYGDTLSNSIAALALASCSTDASTYAGSIAALDGAQQSDGSWSEDPYLTALAVRALVRVSATPSLPTTGGISGQVLDSATHTPVSGAQVVLAGPSSATISVSNGGFNQSNLIPGSYSAAVGAPGYGSTSLTGIQISAGSVTNLGTVLLTANPSTANISGTITDGSTHLPLVGVQITVAGAATSMTSSAADGSYSIASLVPGAVTLTASLSGYNSSSVNVTLTAGETLSFSPSLYPTSSGSGPTTATLAGTVLDSTTQAPIAGATINLGSVSATTEGSGNFSVPNLSAGTFQATISAIGYSSVTLSGTLANGTDAAGTVYLSSLPPTSDVSSVSGIVTDAATHAPIAGASVQVQGTGLSALTGQGGSYQIGNIPGYQFSLVISAPGYISSSGNISLAGPGTATASIALSASAPPAGGGIIIKTVTLSSNPYVPYAGEDIDAEIDNTSSGDIGVILEADVLDTQANVVAAVQAIHLGLNNPPSDAVQVVGAGSKLSQPFDTNLHGIAPGTYQVVVIARDSNGNILAEQGTALTVSAVTAIGGNLALDPPIAQAGIQQTIDLSAQLFNRGNLPLAAGPLQLTVTLNDTGTGALPPVNPGVAVYSGDHLLQNPRGTGLDSAGNLYTLVGNSSVAEVAPNGTATIFATLPYYSSLGSGVYVYPVTLAVDPNGTPWMLNNSQYVFKVGQNNSYTTYKTGLDTQTDLDVDAAGNVYLTGVQGGDHVVAMMNSAGQTTYLVRNGLSTPQDLVADAAGDLYVANYGDNSVSKVGAGGAITRFASGLSHPQSITLDGTGNVFVANSGANDVVELSPSGTSTVFAAGLSNPTDLQFGPDGRLYVLNSGTNTLSILSASGQVTSTIGSVANSAQGTVFDSAGNLLIANTGNNTLTEVLASGATRVLSANLSSPRSVATDASGNVYIANAGSGTVSEYTVGTGALTTLATGLNGPYGVALDGNGDVYVTESRINRISEITASGSVVSVLTSTVNNPRDMILGVDGVPLLANNGTFISRLPASGGSTVIPNLSIESLTQLQNGTLYYTDTYDIFKIDPTTNASVRLAGIPYTQDGLATDGVANFYVTDYNNHHIMRVDMSGVVTTYATLSGAPWGLVRDSGGYLYTVVNSTSLYKIAPDGTSTLLATLSNDQHELALDSNGNLLVSNWSAGTVSTVSTSGVVSTLLSGLSHPAGLVVQPDGSIAVAEALAQRVRVFSRAGSVLQSMYGFTTPMGAVWNGTALVFCDSNNRIYTLVPGQYPQLFASAYVGSGYVSSANGNLYLTSGSSNYVVSSNGAVTSLPYPSGYTGFTSVAVRSDGSLALAGGNQVDLVNSANQVTGAYAGFAQPSSIAVDTASNIYVADQNGDRVIKIPAGGGPTSVYASMNGAPYRVRFSPAGSMYLVGGDGIYQVSNNGGSATRISVAPCCNYGVRSVGFAGANIYATDISSQMVRVANGANLVPYATGVANPSAIRLGPDGAVYIGDASTGSVMRYTQNGLSLFATGMLGVDSMGFDSHGTLYVGSGNSYVYSVSPTGTVTDLGISNVLYNEAIGGLTVDAAGEPLLTMNAQNAIDRVILPVAQTLPPAGTVVYTTTVNAPALSVGNVGTDVSFGTWTPPYGGDFSFEVTPAQPGVAGQLVDALHVGPSATGGLSADQSVVPPGNQPVNLELSVSGADFTSLAKVYPSNLKLELTTGTQSYPHAMGADAIGNVYFMDASGNLKQLSTDGTISTIMSGLLVTGDEVPVDSQQNLYVAKAVTGGSQILRISPSGATSVYATLSAAPAYLAITSDDKLYAAIGGTVLRIFPDGTTQTLYVGSGFHALSADGQGNLYVDAGICSNCANNASVSKITPDGTVTTVATGLALEFEGNGNIAGDCSDNLFVTPRTWVSAGIPVNYNEEVYLVEVVGTTGQPSLVFNSLGVAPGLADMDFMTYDRFHSNLIIWTDDNNGQIYELPISCGAIDTEAHVITVPGQTLTGFNVAPMATLGHSDGSTEYIWDMKAVDASGQNLQFGTLLSGLQIGSTQPVVQSAFLAFKNTFVTNDVDVPLAIPSVQVAPAATLTVTTDASSYPANAPVNVTVGLIDGFATAVNGNLDVEILDASSNVVVDLGAQAASIPATGRQDLTAQWNTGAYITGPYTVEAVLTAADGAVLAQGSAPFGIGVTSTGGNGVLTVGVTTDKASYAPTETVVIDDRLADPASNAIADGISFTTTVTNPDGSVRWSNTSTLAELVPGGLRDISFPLALANAAPGTYGISVAASLNGTALAPATASFTVQSSANTGAGAAGTVSVSPGQVPITSTATLSGSFTNNGNAALANATVTLAVLDPVAGQLVFQSPLNVASLGVGQSVPVQASWTAAGTANQTYVAVLMATVNGVTKTVAQANFKLVDPTTNLSGTVTATPAQVQVTTNLNLAGSVSNAGPAIAGVMATLSIQDPTGATVFTSPVNLGNLAQGQSDPVLATWLAAGPVNQTYTAVLTASVGSFTKTVAQQPFQVIPPPIKFAASMAEGTHGRVLILTDDPAAYPGNQDPFGPNPAPGLAAQDQHIEQVLKAAGWSYTVVTNATDFQTQFNTGGYEVYVILSEAVNLPDTLQQQVVQAVHDGQGLLVAGNHDDRNNLLFAALGIHSTGKSLDATGLTLAPSSLEPAGGQVGFAIEAQPLTVNKDVASILGTFNLTDGTTAPAVFGYSYGSGKGVYMAFDLALEEAAAPANSLFDKLLTDTLAYVHPATLTPYTGRVIPLVLSVQNQGIATPAVAIVTLPAGITVIDPNGGVVSGNTIAWSFSLAVGQTQTETFWVQLPTNAGSVDVSATIDSGTSPNLVPQTTTDLLIGVQAKPQQ